MQAIIFVIRTSIFIILFTQILILSPALHMPSSKPLKQTMRSPFCMCNNTWTCEPGLPKACGLFQRMLNVFSSASRHYLCLIPAPKRTGIVALCQSECINFFFLSVQVAFTDGLCTSSTLFRMCLWLNAEWGAALAQVERLVSVFRIPRNWQRLEFRKE